MGYLRVVVITVQIIMFMAFPKRNHQNKFPHLALAIIISASYDIPFVRPMYEDLVSYFVIFILY